MLDFKEIAKISFNALGEFLYPTRCILCDAPGVLICHDCLKTTSVIQSKLACPRCGAPYGKITCTECQAPDYVDNSGKKIGLTFPFYQAKAFCSYDDTAKAIIKTYKDAGEQRLRKYIALALCHLIKSTDNTFDALVYIPPNKAHVKKRGFDHMKLVAQLCSQWTNIPLLQPLVMRKSLDQRGLSSQDRIRNKQNTFYVKEEFIDKLPRNIILIDDVFTTGATLSAATNALLGGSACRVFVAVFARVW